MEEIVLTLLPSFFILIGIILFIDLYILVRKYLKLKIEELKSKK